MLVAGTRRESRGRRERQQEEEQDENERASHDSIVDLRTQIVGTVILRLGLRAGTFRDKRPTFPFRDQWREEAKIRGGRVALGRCATLISIHFANMCSLRVVLLASLVLLASAACRRDAARPVSFAQSLRCGMTRAAVTRLARARGYNDSDKSWLERTASSESKNSKELMLVDLTFRGDRLVAFREGKYEPRTKRVEYRNVDLCSGR